LPWRLPRLCNPFKWVRKHKSAKVQSVVGQEKWKRKNKERRKEQGFGEGGFVEDKDGDNGT